MTADPQWIEDSFCAQLDELRLISSMYTSAEITFLNGFKLLEFEQTVESGIFQELADISQVSELMPSLKTPEFSLIVSLPTAQFDVNFEFPIGYPTVKRLCLFLRCESLRSAQLSQLSCGAHEFLLSISTGEPQVLAIVNWLSDNITGGQPLSPPLNFESDMDETAKGQTPLDQTVVMTRWWIHSHHIYSKAKRQDLPVLADQLGLSGFLLAGKPGVICVEGVEADVKEFWDRIRIWAWKKIAVRHVETSGDRPESFRKFGKLREQSQMDMTSFKQFLDDHKCLQVFPVLFGLNGAAV